MFRSNDRHRQMEMFSSFASLPSKRRQRLEASWAGTFYREVFCRLDERPFAVLYADEPSRPNIPVNVLVALEVLKAGFGWSDEELYDAFQFSLQVRYAVGCRDFGEDDFELRTLYNFRQRLSRHMQESGENLLEQAFAQVTGEQLAALKLRTGQQRMDSTLIGSNIRKMGRLQLLVEVLQRVYRMLRAPDQEAWAEAFAPYVQERAGHFCYRVREEEIPTHLQEVGQFMQQLVVELAADYQDEPVYQMLCRVFDEHFTSPKGPKGPTGRGRGTAVAVKPNQELSAHSLQSPDDWEATFRHKGRAPCRGYVLNLTETCDPANEVQLLTKAQVAPNCVDDGVLLVQALPDLKARTALAQLWNDGCYVGPAVEPVLQSYGVEQIVTGIRGKQPPAGKMGLADFAWERDADGTPTHVCCPQGQRVELRPGHCPETYWAYFAAAVCATCPLLETCRTKPVRNQPQRVLRRLEDREIQLACKRRRMAEMKALGQNLRAAIEATVRSCKHPFGGKAPVRGQVRVSMFCIAAAIMVNARRIWHYEATQQEREGKGNGQVPSLSHLVQVFGQWLRRFWPRHVVSRAAQPL